MGVLGRQGFVGAVGLFKEGSGGVFKDEMRVPHVAQGSKAENCGQDAKKSDSQAQAQQIGKEAASGQDHGDSQDPSQKETKSKSGFVVGFPETAALPGQVCTGLDSYSQIFCGFFGVE